MEAKGSEDEAKDAKEEEPPSKRVRDEVGVLLRTNLASPIGDGELPLRASSPVPLPILLAGFFHGILASICDQF